MLDPWNYSKKGSEYAEQTSLFIWANMAANFGLAAANDYKSYNEKGYASQFTEEPIYILKRLFAIHNQGHGDAIRGARAAAEGVKRGVPDLAFPVSRTYGDLYQCCGLYIELKRKSAKGKAKGVISDIQKDWLKFLTDQGYVATVCYGWEEARDVILHYLNFNLD